MNGHQDTARDHTALARRTSRLTVITEDPSADTTTVTATGPVTTATTCRGPLLAVCGLCGGAGTSTLAYLIALAVARSSARPVLVADTSSPGGTIASLAGVESPRSLTELADHIAAGLPTGQPIASTRDGLRVLATGPRLAPACDGEALGRLLDQARERYALTVIDCGTLAHQASQAALTRASHVLWVIPATVSAISLAQSVLSAIDSDRLGRQLVLARPHAHQPKAAMTELKRVAHDRQATLILLPDLPDLATAAASSAIEIAQVALQAILGALSRP
ncbi:MAG: hypothetical protein ABSH51_30610 [Solirubrobacteraceae bacterium]|jgi:MinD-like ATPase involved in chromosome partitioning or flagellar assembly